MIEGGAVDWANHANLLGRMIEEQDDFNNSYDAVIEWINTNSNWDESLVIVTSDHETGYLWGPDSGAPDTFNPIVDNGAGNMPGFEYYSSNHTNSLVPLYAKGIGSELFENYAVNEDSVRGFYIDNTNIAHVIFELLPALTGIQTNLATTLPETFQVGYAYPNPFNPTFTVPITMQKNGEIIIELYDILGRSVLHKNLNLSIGFHDISITPELNNQPLTSGTYLLKISNKDIHNIQKISLLK